MNDPETLKSIEKSLFAILMILVEMRENSVKEVDNENGRKIDLLLAEAGFKGPEIAKIISKNLAAVQKSIQRGRK
jgi:hypothetical protein